MRTLRHWAVVAGCLGLAALGLLAGYLWRQPGSGGAEANLRSARVGDTGVTYVTWDGRVALVCWKDFVLS
jgi:hypothetical protein